MITGLADLFQARWRPVAPRLSVAFALLLIAGSVIFVQPAAAANYPLELVSPRQAETAPAQGFIAIPAGHRVFKAYPGIPYNIRAVVVGGAYPFTFALASAPSGMSINATTGEINWPSPSGTTVTPTLTVTDSEGSRVSSPWTITVTTEGFKFVSPNGNDSAAGSVDAPWRTLLKLYSSSSSSDIVYFRTGTYTSDGIPRTSIGSAWERVEFGPNRSARWLAYPGETPVFNFGYVAGTDPSAVIRFMNSSSYPIYLDGLEGRNFRNIGFQIVSSSSNSNYTVLRRLKIHDMIQGIDGENPSGIMFTAGYTGASQYAAVQDSEFYRLNGGGGLKIYSQKKMVIEDSVFRDSSYGFDLKGHCPRFDVRANTFTGITGKALFGNMHPANNEPVNGELRYNNINTPNAEVSLDVNQDSLASEVYTYRNTVVGHVWVRFVESSDGPFTFANNVIVNNNSDTPQGARITYYVVSDPSRIILRDNLSGAPSGGIVDSNGFLTVSYQRYLGTHGHQIGTPPERPNPPMNVTVD